MNLEEIENLGICFDCNKYDVCPKRTENLDYCEEYEEARWCLTPKGIFNTILNDLGLCELLDKKVDVAWELYEHRAPENALHKETFAKVLVDMGFVDDGDNIVDVAFDAFVERMRRNGYLSNKEETKC